MVLMKSGTNACPKCWAVIPEGEQLCYQHLGRKGRRARGLPARPIYESYTFWFLLLPLMVLAGGFLIAAILTSGSSSTCEQDGSGAQPVCTP